MPLYALGSNSSYQLSLTHTNDISQPTQTTLQLPPNQHPIKIVAGSNHTLLLTNVGTLYSTGANKYGQCMRLACDVIPGFERVEGRWRDCAATWEGSIAVAEDGRVWSFGKIKDHENLKGIRVDELVGVKEVKNDEAGKEGRIMDTEGGKWKVVAGVQHFVVYNETYALGYGDSKKGQLGPSPTPSPSPTLIPSPHNILQITCGKDFTLILSPNSQLTLHTTSTKHPLHSLPASHSIHAITSSWSTIGCLNTSGHVISWGRSDHGQLPPTHLPYITQLSAGSEHFIGLSSTTNTVFTWGWNEHGNCGVDSREDVTFLNPLSLPPGETPTYVAAGCGTSWIWTDPPPPPKSGVEVS